MPDERWLPIAEIRLIFRHLVDIIAIAAALYVGTKVFGALIPAWAEVADMIDGYITMCLLAIMGVKLVWAVVRQEGTHAFAAA